MNGFNAKITDVRKLNSKLELLGCYLNHARDNYHTANNDVNAEENNRQIWI